MSGRASSHRVAMMADSIPRLDNHEVEPQGQVGQDRAVGKDAPLQQTVGSGADSHALPTVHGFLGQPEGSIGSPAHLDRDERPRRPRVQRNQVELEPPDMDIAAENRPAGGRQALAHSLLGGIAELLGLGSHRGRLVAPHRLPLIARSRPARCAQLGSPGGPIERLASDWRATDAVAGTRSGLPGA